MQLLQPLVFDQSIRMTIMCNRQRFFFSIGDILYCESNRNYTIFHLIDGSEYCTSRNLAQVYQQLQPHGFELLHKSIVVNLSCISSISQSQDAIVTLANNTRLKVSRRRKPGLMKILHSMQQTVRP